MYCFLVNFKAGFIANWLSIIYNSTYGAALYVFSQKCTLLQQQRMSKGYLPLPVYLIIIVW